MASKTLAFLLGSSLALNACDFTNTLTLAKYPGVSQNLLSLAREVDASAHKLNAAFNTNTNYSNYSTELKAYLFDCNRFDEDIKDYLTNSPGMLTNSIEVKGMMTNSDGTLSFNWEGSPFVGLNHDLMICTAQMKGTVEAYNIWRDEKYKFTRTNSATNIK